MINRNIGIIGYGNMGSVIGQRLKAEYRIWAFDKKKNKTGKVAGINIARDAVSLVSNAETVVLAVKPQDFDSLLKEIKKYTAGRLIISIAAGISTGYIENKLGKAGVIRVMPNLPVRVARGMICICKGKFAAESDLNFAKTIFDYMGITIIIKEEMMNAATAVSGSGPGFLYDLIKDRQPEEREVFANKEFAPALYACAKAVGFADQEAGQLAYETTAGSIALLKETGLAPEKLSKLVTSRGGTTEAGLTALHRTHSLEQAVKAALKRSKQLSKE